MAQSVRVSLERSETGARYDSLVFAGPKSNHLPATTTTTTVAAARP